MVCDGYLDVETESSTTLDASRQHSTTAPVSAAAEPGGYAVLNRGAPSYATLDTGSQYATAVSEAPTSGQPSYAALDRGGVAPGAAMPSPPQEPA